MMGFYGNLLVSTEISLLGSYGGRGSLLGFYRYFCWVSMVFYWVSTEGFLLGLYWGFFAGFLRGFRRDLMELNQGVVYTGGHELILVMRVWTNRS